MLFNVLRELRQKIGSTNEYRLQDDRVRAEDVLIHDLKGTVRFLRTDRGLLARVQAHGLLDAECARCLTGTTAPVDVDFEEEYVPTVNADTGAPVKIEDAEDTFRIDERFNLDLREGLRQYILISEPQKPLCKETCAGLCPICGQNLNENPHECQQPVDGRWSALAGLQTDIPEGN
jgi:uncharacterized protein